MVSTQERDEMKRLRAILDSGFDGSIHERDDIPGPSSSEERDGKIAPPSLSSRRDPAMAGFLAIAEEFTNGETEFTKTAEKSAQSLFESNDPEIQEALKTNHDKNSISIGGWKIKVIEGQSYTKKPIKTYNIINASNNQVIVECLHVYEAARGLVRLLNRGIPLNQHSAQSIIQLEAKYVALREDLYRALKKKKSLSESKQHAQAGIYETRAEEYQHRALLTKKKIIEASNNALRLLR